MGFVDLLQRMEGAPADPQRGVLQQDMYAADLEWADSTPPSLLIRQFRLFWEHKGACTVLFPPKGKQARRLTTAG